MALLALELVVLPELERAVDVDPLAEAERDVVPDVCPELPELGIEELPEGAPEEVPEAFPVDEAPLDAELEPGSETEPELSPSSGAIDPPLLDGPHAPTSIAPTTRTGNGRVSMGTGAQWRQRRDSVMRFSTSAHALAGRDLRDRRPATSLSARTLQRRRSTEWRCP